MRFHMIARGIIRVDGLILLAHEIGASNTFLPGGHIEPGESAEAALIREIEEEFGLTGVVGRFVGAVENMWEDEQQNHEINLIFEVSVPGLTVSGPPDSHEAHLEFMWSTPQALESHNLLPAPLIECITHPETAFAAFWGSSLE